VYLDNAVHGAGAKSVYNAMEDYTREYARDRMGLKSDLEAWKERIAQTREQFAKLIGCEKTEVFFVPTTTTGLNVVANMIATERGSNVVTNDMEYLSNVIVWLKRQAKGVQVRFVRNLNGKIILDDVKKKLDSRTAALTIGQVGWWNGFRHDIEMLSEVAHEKGAYLVVDGIQCVGAMKVDVKREGIDFLVCGTYKWLLGPGGAAFLYVSKDLAEKLEPLFMFEHNLEAKSVETNLFDKFDLYNLKYGSKLFRHDMGAFNRPAYAGSWASMNMILKEGIHRIEEKIKRVYEYSISQLHETGFSLQTPEESDKRFGIVNFKISNCREVVAVLRNEKGVIVSPRLGGIRVSPHFFNTEEDIDTLINGLKELGLNNRAKTGTAK